MDIPTDLFKELLSVGPISALCGYLAYRFMGKSDKAQEAYTDFLANKLQDMTLALNKSSETGLAMVKALEALSEQLKASRGDK